MKPHISFHRSKLMLSSSTMTIWEPFVTFFDDESERYVSRSAIVFYSWRMNDHPAVHACYKIAVGMQYKPHYKTMGAI